MPTNRSLSEQWRALTEEIKAELDEALYIALNLAGSLVLEDAKSRTKSTQIRDNLEVGDVEQGYPEGAAKTFTTSTSDGNVWHITVGVSLDTVPFARAMELGSGMEATEGPKAYIDIVPVNAPALAFYWEKTTNYPYDNPEPEDVVLQHVSHPGIRPQPYLIPALDSNEQAILDIFSESIDRVIA